MSVFELGLLIEINMCFILPEDWQIENEGWFYRPKYQYKRYGILSLPQNIVTENATTAHILYFWKIDRRYFNLANDKNENILPQQVYLTIK